MSDPGLNHRLRQRARRSGFAVGATMALTLALCVGAFTVIFAQLEPIVSDFVTRADPVATSTTETVTQAEPTSEPAPPTGNTPTAEANEPTNPPIETLAPVQQASPTPGDEFVPDYQLSANQPVNLREGPGAEDYDPVTAVPIDAPLMFLGERRKTTDPAGDNLAEGQEWMKFRTEDGDEGWIREIDVTEYEP